ncbi:hypothetical protein HRbin17_00093 [bacterium HR17]|uniref:Uncharacterized protein n=1 Tax=Candidatus Fervidibacter japonicus TaxID=2035412 RepID=A0A2H5X8V3_9BACT|nr:hypothetical protein HRbin17_00093 [bacterium HR17]
MRRFSCGGSESRPPNAPQHSEGASPDAPLFLRRLREPPSEHTFNTRRAHLLMRRFFLRRLGRAALRTHLQHSEGASPDAPLFLRRLGEPPSDHA